MTTQHTHPEYGDVDARDVAEQHAPDMQETPSEVASSNASTSVEQASQAQQEDTSSPPALPPLTIPSLLSFTVSTAFPTPSASDEGETPYVQETGSDTAETPLAAEPSSAPEAVLDESPMQVEEDAFVDAANGQNGQEVQILSLDEQLPLEPAPLHLAHNIEQEEQETSTASDEQDESTVRPFVEYYEEFRKSEARTLAEAPDAFSEFSQSVTTTPPFADEVVEQVAEMPNEEVLPPFDFGEGSSFIPAEGNPISSAIVNANDAEAQSPMDAAITEEQQRASAAGQEEDTQPTRPERPASPLLRPANRHRLRHGASRHREEFVRSQGNEMPVTESASVQPTNETQEQQVQEAQQQEDTASVETPVETPKPTRRYRFDRPASQGTQRSYGSPAASTSANSNFSASNTPVVSTPSENTSVTQEAQTTALPPTLSTQPVSQVTTTNEVGTPTPIDVSTPSTTPQEEQALKREAATIERSAATNGISAPAEQGRRKHGQDRQQERQREKEQQRASSASAPQTPPTSDSDIAALVAETHDALQSDVAPEDLPPLEYADLQKANSRRRRRHRNGQSVTTGTPVKAQETQGTQAQETSAAQPQGTQGTQAAPTMPAASQNASAATSSSQPDSTPYSLTSGFTLNQMNQGNDAAGPFMGPEPSPARGSVFTRNGRTTRAETMRTPSYPSRERDNGLGGGPSSASMNHFANVIAQAIQMQSDRLVAELRSANQGPTNVSVSLPPFPSTERVGVFVDVANLLYSARTMRISIDFGKLLNFLRGNRRLVRAHAYCPTSPQPSDEQMFLQAVKGLGYRITTKNYKTFASGAKKADLDLDLCMDVVRLVDGRAVDCIVLVSGDSDFMPMLDYCSDHGVRVEIAAFDEAMSATLRQSCDMFINLAMLEEIRA